MFSGSSSCDLRVGLLASRNGSTNRRYVKANMREFRVLDMYIRSNTTFITVRAESHISILVIRFNTIGIAVLIACKTNGDIKDPMGPIPGILGMEFAMDFELMVK